MAYIRISIMHPNHGQEKRVAELVRQLNEAAAKQPGCIQTYTLEPHDDSGDIARMAIYEDEHSAEGAASNDHVLAVRSELHLSVNPGHIERAFFTEE